MNTTRFSSWAKFVRASLGVAAIAAALSLGSSAYAASPGAIYTTNSDGTINNENHYPTKEDVFLIGGPNTGQIPPGDYYVRVTEPNGTELGKSIGLVTFVASAGDPPQPPPLKLWDIVKSTSSNYVDTGYDTTSNGGGEYKVWISTDENFENKATKTDNYKVIEDICEDCPCEDCPGPDEILIGGKKYCDANGNGVVDGGEVGLEGWKITIVWSGGSTEAETDADGNWTAKIPADATDLVVTEELKTGWAQTFPLGDGSHSKPGAVGNGQDLTTLDFLNVRLTSICVTKFCDANGNSVQDATEGFVGGWKITLKGSDVFGPILDREIETSGTGSVCFDNLLPGTYTVTEEAKQGWAATLPAEVEVKIESTSCDSTPEPYDVAFANVQLSEVCVYKFYDKNADGDKAGDSYIANWKISLVGASTTTGTTDANGKICFLVLPGEYTVMEGLPTNVGSTWQASTATSVALSVGDVPCNAAPPAINPIYFGNFCLGKGGGLTLGFWSNKNGQALVDAGDLAALNALPLVNPNGSYLADLPFATANQVTNSAKTLSTWLLNASATNMASMLSVQLTAMTLNVRNGKVVGTQSIYAPGVPGAVNGYATVNAVMAAAANQLAGNPNTTAQSADRAIQEAIKNALDRANNDLNVFVQTAPCTFSFATTP